MAKNMAKNTPTEPIFFVRDLPADEWVVFPYEAPGLGIDLISKRMKEEAKEQVERDQNGLSYNDITG